MADQYQLDLTQFSLNRLQQTLEKGDVLPSRAILKDDLAARFAVLKSKGINNLQDLINALSTTKKLERFAQESGLPCDYLTILGRQARSYIPSPVNLNAIPGVDPAVVERLAAVGIKHSKHLFERSRTKKARADLAQQADIADEVLIELVRMADVARAGWVGPVFARMLYEAGADSLETLAACSPEDLYEKLLTVNRMQQFTKGSFSVKDVANCIETAKELPQVIEW